MRNITVSTKSMTLTQPLRGLLYGIDDWIQKEKLAIFIAGNTASTENKMQSERLFYIVSKFNYFHAKPVIAVKLLRFILNQPPSIRINTVLLLFKISRTNTKRCY